MRILVGKILAVAAALYIFAAAMAVPYFNWRYAQEHGFVRWLFLGEFIATAQGFVWPYFVTQHFSTVGPKPEDTRNVDPMAKVVPKEYVDHQYEFAFEFPADWKFEKSALAGEAGEVRAIVGHPTKAMRVIAMVGQIGKSLSRRQFESSPNRDAVVEGMMELSLEQYRKTSRDIRAERMIVSEKRIVPSNAGIKFYISTAHITGKVTMLMAGLHIVPFEKPYMVTFIMIAPVEQTPTSDREALTRIFNSFHVLQEQPIK